MCGIAGIIDGGNSTRDLKPALASMAHRGPDGNGIFSDAALTLLHARLAIQDLSNNAAQPMISADGRFVLIFNGEIYNHKNLREAMANKGQSFESDSDTETLLYGFIHYGTAILEKLQGIFAFAVYDKERRTLFSARDRFGVKPFYYYCDEVIFAFASEIKTITTLTDIKRTINADALFQTLMLQWQLSTDTGFEQVKKLLPGHSLELNIDDLKSLKIQKWAPEFFNGAYENLSEEAWIERLDMALNNALRRQLLSDKPIAYFLSGGLDSSLLLAIAHKIEPKKATKAFTIDAGESFQKEGFSADLPYAKMVAEHLNIPLEVIKADVHFLDDFDAMIYQLDEAQADIAPVFVRQIAKAAKSTGYDVLIGGTGGDDVFTGYRRHQAIGYDHKIEYAPFFLRKIVKLIIAGFPDNPKTRRLKKLAQNIDQTRRQRMFGYFFWNDKDSILGLFTKDFRATINTSCIEEFFEQTLAAIAGEKHPINQALQLELNGFLPDHNLNYTDKMGMMESVEIRVPYLDEELVALAAKIPPELKIKGGTTKYLLRKVAEKYLPKEVIYRPKTGFGAPIRSWMLEDKAFQNAVWERLNRSEFTNRNIFDTTAVASLFNDTVNKKKDGSYTLLALLAIESWLRQFAI